MEGEFKSYHNNGQLNEICNYVGEKIEGEYKEYYDNGQLYFVCNYINGEIKGEYKRYHNKHNRQNKFRKYDILVKI